MFWRLHDLLEEGDLVLLAVSREGGLVRVNVVPRRREGQEGAHVHPLSVLGTPDELDDPIAGFAAALGAYGEGRASVLEAGREAAEAQKTSAGAIRQKANGGRGRAGEARPAEPPPTDSTRAGTSSPPAPTSPAPGSPVGQPSLFGAAPSAPSPSSPPPAPNPPAAPPSPEPVAPPVPQPATVVPAASPAPFSFTVDWPAVRAKEVTR